LIRLSSRCLRFAATLATATILAFGLSFPTLAQQSAVLSASIEKQIGEAVVGQWTGVLEYRDYRSDAHVKLPTWLEVSSSAAGLTFHYVYDDGPKKVVDETEVVMIDAGKATYTIAATAKQPADEAHITGLETLKAGRGTLILLGSGTDNGKKVDVRTTLHIGRNILEILREVRSAGEEFKFRHAYTFTRAQAPQMTPTAQ
jgi:hypothetical protein